METVLLSTGIDIGTSTTGMVISRLTIRNTAGMFSVPHADIVDKQVIYKSSIYHTPLVDECHIDIPRIQQILMEEYGRAGIGPEQIETGAVIITGESAVKENARLVIQAVSGFAGDFVVATAGPDLESVISGQGSGAQHFSEQNHCSVLNIDIGGGTSNFALFDCGVPRAKSCYDIGGRLIKVDSAQRITAISPRIAPVLERLGITLRLGERLREDIAEQIAAIMAEMLGKAAQMLQDHLLERLHTRNSGTLSGACPQYLSLSGGVSELLGRLPDERFAYGDIGVFLAEAISKSAWYQNFQVAVAEEKIRATVVGAGSYTTMLSGSTISVDPPVLLPLKNLPVLLLTATEEQQAREGDGELLRQKLHWFLQQTDADTVAMALPDVVAPSYRQIRALAQSVAYAAQAIEYTQPLVVLCGCDFAKALGQCLKRAAPERKMAALDGVAAGENDYLDIGRPVLNGIAVPVIVKTLLVGR